MSDESVSKGVPTGATKEIGNSGLRAGRPYGGQVAEEFLLPLRGMQGMRKLREMADNDPVVGAFLFAIKMLIKQVKWRVDASLANDDDASDARDWVEDVLFRGLDQPFGDVVSEALSMLVYGYAPLEIVYAKREDGTLGVAKLAIRSQETVWRWTWDENGEVTGMEQWRLDGPNVVIPLEKMLLFRTESTKRNPEGRSLLRNAYIPYVRKNTIEEAEGRLALRAAGIVTVTIPGNFMRSDADTEEKAIFTAYKQAADRIAADRQGSLILPSDTDDKGNPLFSMSYSVVDTRDTSKLSPIVDRHNRMIVTSVLADFILLGQDATGSFALSSDKTTLFARAVGTILDAITEQFNRVLIPRLWEYNGFDDETMPKLVPGDLQAPDLDALGNFIQKLAQSGMQIFPSPDGAVERHLMQAAGLPLPDVEEG